jgi:hemolysin activation/secretion protein
MPMANLRLPEFRVCSGNGKTTNQAKNKKNWKSMLVEYLISRDGFSLIPGNFSSLDRKTSDPGLQQGPCRKGGPYNKYLAAVMPRLLIVLLLLAASGGACFAQERDEAQRLLQERQERERTEALTRPAPAVASGAATVRADGDIDPSQMAEQEPAFLIRHIAIKGDTLLSEATRETLLAPFVGLKLGPRRIDLLLRRFTAAYMQRGYITTRAYIGPQNLASGELEVTVIPGTVESVRLNGAPLAGAAAAAIPQSSGEVLRLADVEQAVDQINRLRSNRAEAQILPGQSPGTSVIAIENRPEKPWRISLGTDNYGQPATGQGRVRAGVDVDNLLGVWDAWSVTHVESRDSRADLFVFSVPAGYGTFSYAYARSGYLTPIGNIAVTTGNSRNQTLAWNQVLDRDAHGRTALDAALAMRESWRRLNEISLTPQQQASLRLAVSRQQRFAAGSVSAELGFTKGLDAFGYDQDLPGLPDTAAHNQFEKVDVNLAAILALGPHWAWRGKLTAQDSRVGLPGAEQLFAGGAATVRGFQEGIIAGDRGQVLRNELQWTGAMPRAILAAGVQLAPFAFIDASRTRLLADNHDKRLASLGLGLRMVWKYASLEAAWAHPVDSPDGVSRADRVHANLTLQF